MTRTDTAQRSRTPAAGPTSSTGWGRALKAKPLTRSSSARTLTTRPHPVTPAQAMPDQNALPQDRLTRPHSYRDDLRLTTGVRAAIRFGLLRFWTTTRACLICIGVGCALRLGGALGLAAAQCGRGSNNSSRSWPPSSRSKRMLVGRRSRRRRGRGCQIAHDERSPGREGCWPSVRGWRRRLRRPGTAAAADLGPRAPPTRRRAFAGSPPCRPSMLFHSTTVCSWRSA